MESKHRLHRWEAPTEWPLAIIAVMFLAAYAVQVLAHPHGALNRAVTLVTGLSWAIFAADYGIRLALGPDRRRFFHHLFDLAIVLLPLMRPLRRTASATHMEQLQAQVKQLSEQVQRLCESQTIPK